MSMTVIFVKSVGGKGWSAKRGDVIQFENERIALNELEAGHAELFASDKEDEIIPEPEPVVEPPKTNAKPKKSKKSE